MTTYLKEKVRKRVTDTPKIKIRTFFKMKEQGKNHSNNACTIPNYAFHYCHIIMCIPYFNL